LTIVFGNAEWVRPLQRPRYKWKDNIKVEFKDIESKDVNSIHLVQNRVQQRAALNARFGSMKRGDMFYFLSYNRLLKKDPAAWSSIFIEATLKLFRNFVEVHGTIGIMYLLSLTDIQKQFRCQGDRNIYHMLVNTK
jgi:hypothetical protein